MRIVIKKLTVWSLLIVLAFSANSGLAQTETKTPSAEDQQVMAIYKATKTAKSAKDYTQMLADCEQFLAGELTEKNRNYVTSLTGWALNRRGGLRLETAEQLKLVGNAQAAEAMSKAMSDFDEAIKADPSRWRSWLSRGIAYVSQQKLDLAVKDFDKVIELKPDEFKALFNRGEANYYLGKFEQAVADYSSVLVINDNDLMALTSRGHAFFALAKYPEALADYELVNKLLPDNCESHINLGDVFQELGSWQKAEEAYKQAIKLDPSAIALQRFAWLKATCPDATYRDAATAREMIDQAIALGDESPVMLDTLAAAQAANGEFDVAKQTQQQAIKLVTSLEKQGQGDTKSEYQTRMAMYEEGVPYQQDK